uniref:Uncharacterized protein LOC111127222 isoform X1 n=1 Tax=Crassostrea virginica TaxID=6565 RepID=A0A8B8DJX0_CRAVI|nr:uncharacterized protein LOC111127222 isoform X1 [Crassostrea virginica]
MERRRPVPVIVPVCLCACLGSFVHGYIQLSSSDRYQQLSAVCINAVGRNYIEFAVKASTDVHVALMTDDLITPRDDISQFYEVVIGGWSNARSCIRAQNVSCDEIDTPGILDSNNFVQLWIGWENSIVQLGQGLHAQQTVAVSHVQVPPYDINYLAVMTHYPSPWRFNEDTNCTLEEFANTEILINDTTCNGITQYACADGYNLTSGNLSRVCGIGQHWIGDPPVCLVPRCPEVLSTSAVTVLSQDTHIGGRLFLTCAQNHVLLSGDLSRTCLSSASWDGMDPICEACLCPSAVTSYQFNTTEELMEKIEEMTRELKVVTRDTNAYMRSKISVADPRPSSTSIGVLLGWGILVSLVVVLLLCDARTMLRHLRHGVR